MSDDPIREFRQIDDEDWIHVPADGINLTVPWRLAEYGPKGPLTEDQVRELAERFDFHPRIVRAMSSRLGGALNPKAHPYHVRVRRSDAAARGASELQKALRDVAAAQERLAAATQRVAKLHGNEVVSREHDSQVRRATEQLSEGLTLIQEAQADLDCLHATPGSVLVREPTDKRRVKDGFRGRVLAEVAMRWILAGRTFVLTTDPLTSERRGDYIAFANAIVGCVTDPPSKLPAETIYKEFRPLSLLNEAAKVSGPIDWLEDDQDT